METRVYGKKIANSEKSEKFFLKIGELIWYNYYIPRKQKTFVAYFEAGESFALRQSGYFPWKRRG